MTNVDKIVNRFLGWKLPKDFAPDGGISFKRESDYEHPVFGRSVYEPVGTHLFTTDQAKAMFEYCLQGLAEPVKQEPVAHYKDAPHTIYLQTGCDDPEDCECSFNEWGDTTWCADQIHDTDIPYIRADYAAPVSAKREWVDLTPIELAEAFVDKGNADAGIRAVIAAFKEKNK